MISKALTESGFFNPNQIHQCLVSELEICQRWDISARPTNTDNWSTKSPCSSCRRLSQREAEAKKESYRMLVWPRFSSGGSIFVMWHLTIQCHSVMCSSPTSPGAHWVSMALISGNSSSLTAAGDSGCHRAQVQSSLHHSSLEAKPQLNSQSTEWKSGKETLLNRTLRRFQKRQRPRSWGSPWASSIQRKLQFKPSELSGIFLMFDPCVYVHVQVYIF